MKAAAALVVLAVAAVTIITHTDRFRDLLRTQALSYLNTTYHGHFTIRKISASVWGATAFEDLDIQYDNSPVLSVPRVELHYELLPLLGRRLSISSLVVKGPTLHLVSPKTGEWNLLAAFSPRKPQPKPSHGTSFAVSIGYLTLEHADISISEPDGKTYQLVNTVLNGMLEIESSGTRVDLYELGTQIRAPGAPEVSLAGQFSYDNISNVDGSVSVPALSLTTQDSLVSLSGKVTDLRKKTVDATVTMKRLGARDVNAFLSNVMLARDLSGTVRISGDTPAAIQVEAAIAAGDPHVNAQTHATLSAKLSANLSGAEPTYDCEAQLEGIDLHQLLRPVKGGDLPAGIINGTLRANGHGSNIADLAAQVALQDRGVSANGWNAGDVSLTANYNHSVATVSAMLTSGAGRGRLDGDIDTTGQTSYKLRLAVDHLEPRRMNAKAGIPAADLNMIANIRGTGLTPASMDAAAHLNWLRSQIGPTTIDSGEVDAQISKGVLHIANAYIQSQGSLLSVKGDAAFATRPQGHLRYTADVRSLAPWLALAGHPGDGSITLAGDASGDLNQLHVVGSAEFSAVRFEKYALSHGHLTYDLSGASKINSVRGQLAMALTDLRAGIALKSVATEIRFQPGQAETAYVSVNATETPSRSDALAAQVSYEPRHISANLTRLSLATDAGTWRLNRPAAIAEENGTLQIRGLRLDSNDQSIFVDGTVSSGRAQNLTARIEQLRLATLSPMMPGKPQLGGIASAQLSVRGTAAAPEVTLAATLNDLEVSKMRYQGLSANLEYAGARASLAMTLRQDTAHSLEMSGHVPVSLGWAHGFQHEVTGDIDVQAKSSGLDLAFVEAFGGKVLQNVHGTLRLDVNAHGPLQHPQPSGFIQLAGGQFHVKPLGVDVKNADARLALASNAVRLLNLSAAAGDGTINGVGSASLVGNTPQLSGLKITLENWPAINTSEYQAVVAGDINCSGPLNALQVRGSTEVLHGLIRPELELLQGESLEPDSTIKVEKSWKVPARISNEQAKNAPSSGATPSVLASRTASAPDGAVSRISTAGSPASPGVTVNLDTTIHRDTWIKTEDSAVELEGKLHLYKSLHGQPSVSGVINGVRGNLVVTGKTFKLSRARITFTGGHQIDPSLDLAAQYTVRPYEITAAVTGTAKKPVLALSSIPNLQQADIVSMLMFGKPVDQLTASEQRGLQQQALSMAGGYAASQIGQSIAHALGLQNLGMTVSQQGGVSFGHYMTQDVYISASQEAASTRNNKASVNYYLTPHLELDTSASTNSNVGNQIELNWKKDY
jgi:autotransporter translocation and assembly factor TamB